MEDDALTDRRANVAIGGRPSPGTSAVDDHPDGASPEGRPDLVGDATEWVHDRYGPWPDGPAVDLTGPGPSTLATATPSTERHAGDRVTRGAGWRCSAGTEAAGRQPRWPDPTARRSGLEPALREVWLRVARAVAPREE